MIIPNNPALYEEPRNQPMRVTPLLPRETLLHWLEHSGRFRASEINELEDYKTLEDLDGLLEPEVYASEDDEEELE